jgi:outer membrane protein assembly factor BamB
MSLRRKMVVSLIGHIIGLTSATVTEVVTPDVNFRWEYTLATMVCSSAIGADGTIYVGADDQKLYAIKPDGMKKWDVQILCWV